MTAAERQAIESLRADLAGYRLEVREYAVKQAAGQAMIFEMHRDVYGVPGEKGEHPGLMGEVSSLKRSRRAIGVIFTGIWGLTVVALGALIGLISGR